MTLNSSSSMFSDPQLESLLAGLATNEAETLIRTSALIQHISYRDGFGFKMIFFALTLVVETPWLFIDVRQNPIKDQPKMRFVNLVQFRNLLRYWIIHVQKFSERPQKQLKILFIQMIQQSWICVAVGDLNPPSG